MFMIGIYNVLPQIITGALICILFIVIIGLINFNEKVKKIILWLFSIIYNACFGFFIDWIMIWSYRQSVNYLPKLPRNMELTISASDMLFQISFCVVSILIYTALLIPINIYMKKKSKINTKVYVISNIIAKLIGIIIYYFVFMYSFVAFLGDNR